MTTKPYKGQPYYVRTWVDPYHWRDKSTPQDITHYMDSVIFHLEMNEMNMALWYWELCCLMDTKA